jgi:CubicO group peptidase (beta-lactamase class C family)
MPMTHNVRSSFIVSASTGVAIAGVILSAAIFSGAPAAAAEAQTGVSCTTAEMQPIHSPSAKLSDKGGGLGAGEVCFTGKDARATDGQTVIAVALIEPEGGPDTARMDQIVQSYVDAKQFMGSVLIARGDAILFNKSYGMANLEWNVPNTPTTKFRIGSITKQFTAAATLLLEERGKLKVEDPVKKYIPDAPEAWDKITLYNVLTHTGGIPNFTDFPDYPQKSLSPMTAEQIVAWFKDKPLDFDPGAKFSYSNSDYVLLGYLIEKLSGQSYEKFLQENILSPLGMEDSGYDSNTAIIEHRASGYSQTRAGPLNAGYVNMTVPHGAGALYSTTLDLLKWEEGLFGGKLLKPESLAKMTTPFKENYAFGLIIQTTEGRKNIWHNGAIQGFNASLGYYPDSKVTVAVLSNLNGNAPDEMLPKLAAVAHGQAVQLSSERKEIKLPRETLGTYVGTYELQPRIKIMITLAGDQLQGQLSGQGKLPLFAEAEGKFFLKVVDAQLEFLKDANGKITNVILHQNGRDQRAHRISDSVLERKEIKLSTETLTAYAGNYDAGIAKVAVTFEDGHLMMRFGPQPKAELFPESETSFFLKTVDAQIEFTKDASGAIIGLTLHQGPRDVKAERK